MQETAAQSLQTIDRLTPVWEQHEVLKKSYADLQTQTQAYQTKEVQWSADRAALSDQVANLKARAKELEEKIARLETDNKGTMYTSAIVYCE